ncbi:hypothetical protein JXB41_08300 [Candidatus Woesearchaeota archaeon]|nr:hypothetical protein [Candidatus Woesearchaeota archaeon]
MVDDFEKLKKYQSFLQKSIIKERQIDKKIELITIINHLTAGPKNLVQKEQIIIEANSRGFSDDEIEKLIQELKRDNIIYETSPGYIKKR